MLLELNVVRKGVMNQCSTRVLDFKKADLGEMKKPSEQGAMEKIIKIHLGGRGVKNAKIP